MAKQVAKQVVTKAKAVVSTTSQVLTQLKENVSQFVSTTAQTISSGVQYVASVAQETYQTVTQQIIPTVSRYITDKVKSVATKVEQDWEATKDALETGLKACIQAKNTVSEVVQRAGQWWQESDLNQALTEKAETISAAFQNSAIGRGLAAINQTVEKATEQIANTYISLV